MNPFTKRMTCGVCGRLGEIGYVGTCPVCGRIFCYRCAAVERFVTPWVYPLDDGVRCPVLPLRCPQHWKLLDGIIPETFAERMREVEESDWSSGSIDPKGEIAREVERFQTAASPDLQSRPEVLRHALVIARQRIRTLSGIF